MKLIIDIDEDVYKKIVADKYAIYDKMFYSIKNGTPLSKTGHWIPVSEKLPEINDDVLISLEWGIDIGRYSDGEWHSEWINNYDDGNVYAWMPLPKPYEPQESEG